VKKIANYLAGAMALAALALAGCGTAAAQGAPEPNSTPSQTQGATPTPASTWTPAEGAFWSYVTSHTTNYPESSMPEGVKAGHSTCDALDEATGETTVSDQLVEIDAETKPQQTIVIAAAIELCAEYGDEVKTFYANGGTKAYGAQKAKDAAAQKAATKRDNAIRARVEKSKHVKAWTRNQSRHPGITDDFDPAEAAVNVCWDMREQTKDGATEDEAAATAAENFSGAYLEDDKIAAWSPNPAGTMQGWSGSFVEEVLYSEKTSMCKN